MRNMLTHSLRFVAAFALLVSTIVDANAAETAPATQRVKVVDGVVQPRRPLDAAIADAMRFLRKADGAYVPGKLDGELAGYFTSAFVNEDGSRAARELAFP